jgi:hypothetical protein
MQQSFRPKVKTLRKRFTFGQKRKQILFVAQQNYKRIYLSANLFLRVESNPYMKTIFVRFSHFFRWEPYYFI